MSTPSTPAKQASHKLELAKPNPSLLDRYGETPELRVRTAMDALARGKAIILVDDEDRENEGAGHRRRRPRGTINLWRARARAHLSGATDERLRTLDLPPMVENNTRRSAPP